MKPGLPSVTLHSFKNAPAREPSPCAEQIPLIQRHYLDLCFLEDLCETVHNLPTMQAAVGRTPGLSDIPIYAIHCPDKNYGSYSKDGIEINLLPDNEETMDERFDAQVTTLPHEFRHGYQDVAGCMRLTTDSRVKRHLEDHIMFERVVEADATAFSLAVAYELYLLKGNDSPINRAWEVHRGSVSAYWNSAQEDEDNHWSGRAAQEAFQAYFDDDNSARLESYDLELCEKFMRAAKKKKDGERTPIPVPSTLRQDLFSDYMKPLSSMPYINICGKFVERAEYRPHACKSVMDNISSKAEDYISEANRIFFRKPKLDY
jgi:hypothetical protein